MYKIKLEKKVLKFLEKHKWEKIISIFTSYLKILQNNPYNNRLDIKKLSWSKSNFRLRIWKYRFIYEIFENELIILFSDSDSRWDIYK
jgi:mRNA interferase RelE/StbE